MSGRSSQKLVVLGRGGGGRGRAGRRWDFVHVEASLGGTLHGIGLLLFQAMGGGAHRAGGRGVTKFCMGGRVGFGGRRLLVPDASRKEAEANSVALSL